MMSRSDCAQVLPVKVEFETAFILDAGQHAHVGIAKCEHDLLSVSCERFHFCPYSLLSLVIEIDH
jgi:hypothetical protein